MGKLLVILRRNIIEAFNMDSSTKEENLQESTSTNIKSSKKEIDSHIGDHTGKKSVGDLEVAPVKEKSSKSYQISMRKKVMIN